MKVRKTTTKKVSSRKTTKPAKAKVEFVKLSSLTKKQLATVNLEEVWVMRQAGRWARTKGRLCGCRNVCYA